MRPAGPGQLPATGAASGAALRPGGAGRGARPGRHRPVGHRNRQLWESTRNLYNLVATGALDPRQVDHRLLAAAERCGLLEEEPRQAYRTLAPGRQVGLAHPAVPPGPPILNAPIARHRPCGRPSWTKEGVRPWRTGHRAG